MMNVKTALELGLGLWIILLLAFPVGADKMPSVYKVNATLNCSPIRVTAVNTDWGIQFIANGTCEGYVLNPTNLPILPRQGVYHIGHWNVTGQFYRDYESTLHIQKKVYKPGESIPVVIYFKMRYKPVILLRWALSHDSMNISLYQFLWFYSVGDKRYPLDIDLYWKGTVPVRVDWVSVLAGLMVGIPIILGLVLAPIASGAVKGKRLRNTLWNAGLFFGWLVAPIIISTSVETQIGSFVVVQLLFLAVWFSSINHALYLTLPKPVKTPGNIALALYFITVLFSFAWALKTGNSEFAFGSLLLIGIFSVLLTMGIQRGLDELKVNGERINPSSLSVLLFIAYVPFLLLWGCVMKSIQLTIFATTFFGLTLLAGLFTTKHYRENGNIHEPPNLY